ncbi:uncharacterized protein [Ptychodera flava]|uniref:uncharacterized protein n=1 Tax=Ptychodera flava TaxID=63121 RepID=UPI00396A7C72
MDATELRKYCLLGKNDDIAVQNTKDIVELMSLDKSDNLLEVGCGTGGLSKYLSAYVKSITAFDVSPAMIQEAREHFPGNNIEYHVADARDPSSYEKYGALFDKVVANYSLQWMGDLSACLPGICHCLKPGGRCYITISSEYPEDTYSKITAYSKNPKWQEYMQGYEWPYHPFPGNEDDMRKLLQDAGFKSQCIDCKAYVEEFALDETRARAYCRAFMGAKERVPCERQEEYMNEAFEFATKRQTDGSYILTCKILSVVAEK